MGGFPEKRMLTPRKIAAQLDEVLRGSLLEGHATSEELAEWNAQVPIWTEMCERLEDAGIPCSIAHRDLRKVNFARSKEEGGARIFFDWGQGCVTHPFVHLCQLRNVKGVTENHVESYLELWKGFVPDMEKLKKIETLAFWVNDGLRVVEYCRRACITEPNVQMQLVRSRFYAQDVFLQSACFCLRKLADAVPIYVNRFGEV